MSLTSLTALKTHLGITGTTEDAFLGQLLTAVEAVFTNLIDRKLESTEYVEYYGGRNTPVLLLREYPVTEVSDVRVDETGYWGQGASAFAATTALAAGIDYALVKDGRSGIAEVGRLLRIGTVWPARFVSKVGLLSAAVKPGAGNIKVSYTAGYEEIPADVKLCLHQVCAQIRRRRTTGQLILAESFEDYSYQLGDIAREIFQTGSPAQIVGRYKRVTPRFEVLT